MKPIKIFGIIAPFILALFILSLFSGTVAAQATPGVQDVKERNIREQSEKIKEQYRIDKEKFDNTKKKFEDSKKLFEDANQRFKKARDNKTGNLSAEVIEKAREYILKAIEHTQNQLQVMKDRLDNPEIKAISTQDAEKIIDAHMAQLEQLKVKVSNATTIQEIRDSHKELAGIVAKINLETRYFLGMVLNYRIDNFITRAENVSEKVDAAIEKLEAEGKDTTKLKAEAEDFKKKIDEAKELQSKTIDLFATHSGFAADGTVTVEKDARAFLKQANELQRDTIKKLKEGGRQLIEFGKDFRKLGRVKMNEKGDLEVNGGATTTLSGQ